MIDSIAKAETLTSSSGLSRSEFEVRHARLLTPALLSDAAQRWAALEWTLDFFRTRYGDRTIEVDGVECGMGVLMDRIEASDEASPAPYLRNVNLLAVFPELGTALLPAIPYALPNRLQTRLFPRSFLRRSEGLNTQLFIGGAGRRFPNLHWDKPAYHTWSTLLCGRKEWFLFGADQTSLLYPRPGAPEVSQVRDVYKPDLESFPLFAQSKPIRVVQQPGETVFVPSGWWHTAKNLAPSISVASDQLCSSSWNGFANQIVSERSDRPVYARGVATYLFLVKTALDLREKFESLSRRDDVAGA